MSILKTGFGAFVAATLAIAASNPAGAAQVAKTSSQKHIASAATGGATDFSARRRGGGGGGGGAAAAAAFAGIVGTAIAVGAARRYDDDGYDGSGSRYYGDSPYDSYNSYGGSYGSRSGAFYGGPGSYSRPEMNPNR